MERKWAGVCHVCTVYLQLVHAATRMCKLALSACAHVYICRMGPSTSE